MTKKSIHISIGEYAYDRLLSGFHGNVSARIVGLALKGQDSEFEDTCALKQRLYEAEKKIKDLDDENNKLKFLVGNLKNKLSNELTDNEKWAKAIKNRGLMG